VCALFFTFVLSLLVFQVQICLVNQSTCKNIIYLYDYILNFFFIYLLIHSGENYAWHKINYMVKLSQSVKSPFRKSLCENISYVWNYRKYIKKEDDNENGARNYIEWKNAVLGESLEKE